MKGRLNRSLVERGGGHVKTRQPTNTHRASKTRSGYCAGRTKGGGRDKPPDFQGNQKATAGKKNLAKNTSTGLVKHG